jgi:aldehyde dehydrogenase (NAD+)
MTPSAGVAEFCHLIDGRWCPSTGGARFETRNPADTREVVGRYAAGGADDAHAAVQAAAHAFDSWRRTPIGRRARILTDAADALDRSADELAREITREEGKLLSASREEVLRTAATLRFYAVEGQTLGGETFAQDDPGQHVYTRREPVGVVAAITPWNFPLSIPARKIAPALISGNTVVFKPASVAPLAGLRLAEALLAAGLPAGVLNVVTGAAAAVGPAITTAAAVRAITFTGSTSAGEQIHRSVPFTTRTQLELGGKNPLIVLDDADLDAAVELAVKGGLSLTGQACTGTSRLLVAREVRAEFTRRLLDRIGRLVVGNGLQQGVDIGPLASAQQLDSVLGHVARGRGEARWLCGGERLRGEGLAHGHFVSPALFDEVTPDMHIARAEIFGPVLAIIEVSDYADAIAKANDSEYGLSAAIATRDARAMHCFVGDIEAGTVKINRTTTGNLVNAPFGGLKRSSTAALRESGRAGLEFFTQTKTVYHGC